MELKKLEKQYNRIKFPDIVSKIPITGIKYLKNADFKEKSAGIPSSLARQRHQAVTRRCVCLHLLAIRGSCACLLFSLQIA